MKDGLLWRTCGWLPLAGLISTRIRKPVELRFSLLLTELTVAWEFLAAPSRDQVESFKRTELAELAVHLGLQGIQNLLKKDLKDSVMAALEKEGLLQPPFSDSSDLPLKQDMEDGQTVKAATSVPVGAAPERLSVPDEQDALSRQTPFTGESLSTTSSAASMENARLRLRLARMKYEAEEKSRLQQIELEIRRCEIEAETKLKLKRMELEYQARGGVSSTTNYEHERSMDKQRNECDISKCLVLVPTFRESEVDSYFATFERLAAALDWPQEVWSTMLQCKLTGKAQEVIASLSLSDSMDYNKVKAAVLVAYELVPEAYRQKFRSQNVKLSTQTYVEFSREKALMFEKWILASKVETLQDLKELILLEEFKKCLPERLALYLNERQVSSLSSAALLADEFVLTHRVGGVHQGESARPVSVTPFRNSPSPPRPQKPRCYYCHLVGHVARDCVILKRRNEKRGSAAQPVGFVSKSGENNSGFGPFMSEGQVSLTESCEKLTPVKILRDTGASQTLISQKVLPFDDLSSTGSSVLLAGVNAVPVSRPLHRIYLRSGLFTGLCEVAVCPSLPVEGVALLLGNDLAGGAVIPPPVVKENIAPGECEETPAGVLPTCVCTRSQAKRAHEILDLSSLFDDSQSDVLNPAETTSSTHLVTNEVSSNMFPLSPASLEAEQRSDKSLTDCFEHVGKKINGTTGYVKNDVLLRNWGKPVAKNITDRRRKNCVCNVIMLERYLSPQTTAQPPGEAAVCAAAAITPVLDEVTQTHLVAPELPLCSIYLDNIVTHTSSWDDLLALENPVTHLEPTSLTTNLATHCFYKKVAAVVATLTFLLSPKVPFVLDVGAQASCDGCKHMKPPPERNRECMGVLRTLSSPALRFYSAPLFLHHFQDHGERPAPWLHSMQLTPIRNHPAGADKDQRCSERRKRGRGRGESERERED
ncbi:uncharacterized protein [Nothobranchius furzeri]|uniref:uncharacterized protein n=1 Tax=Nothobranchius furzeri TaxID=105023 RepID=UPI003904CCB6